MDEVNLREYIPLLVLALIGVVSAFRKKKTADQQQDDHKPDINEDVAYRREKTPDLQMPPSPWNFDTSSNTDEILDRYEQGEEGGAMTKATTPNSVSLSPEGNDFTNLSIEEYLKKANNQEGAEKQYDYDDHGSDNSDTFEFDPKMAFVYSEIMKPKFKE